jgi:hypothetical protein
VLGRGLRQFSITFHGEISKKHVFLKKRVFFKFDLKYPITLFKPTIPIDQIARCNNILKYESQKLKHIKLIEKYRLDFLEIEKKETIQEDINGINDKINETFTDSYIQELIEKEFLIRFQFSPHLMNNKTILVKK